MLLLTGYCKLCKLLLFYSLHPTVFCMMNFHTWHLAVRCQLRTLSVYSLLTVIAFWQLLTVNCFRFTANCLLKVFITYYQLLTVVFTAHIAFFLLYVFTAYCKLLTVHVYSLLPVAYCTCLHLTTICLMYVLTAYRQLSTVSFNNLLPYTYCTCLHLTANWLL